MALILSEGRAWGREGGSVGGGGGGGGGRRELERLMAGTLVFDAAILGAASCPPLIGSSQHIYLFP